MVSTRFSRASRSFSCCQDPGPFGTFGQVSIFLELPLKFLAILTFWFITEFLANRTMIDGGKIDAKPVLSSDYSIDLKKD